MTKIKASKMLSFLLCFVMIAATFGQLPMVASAAESDSAQLTIQQGGKDVNETELTKKVNAELTVAGAGAGDVQWQYYAAEYKMWINIYGETADKCVLTYAKVCNMLDDNDQTVIRCTQKDGDKTIKSNEVTVTVGEAADKTGSAASTYAVRRSATKAAASTYDAASQADDEEQKTTYSIVINYLFKDGTTKAADPHTATIESGSAYSATVDNPSILGYEATYSEGMEGVTFTKEAISYNFTNINEDKTINVIYQPTNVNYTVIHYKQNINNDEYTEFERETKTGITQSEVPDVEKSYKGFYALIYAHPEIAADGSTIVEIYYDRYYYLMNFDLDGGYGVEPVYARYETPVDVGIPTKAGYTFQGWSLNGDVKDNLPETMPAESSTYKAVWGDAEIVNYTVVYWKENADPNSDGNYGYSYWGSKIKTATAGTQVSGSDSVTTDINNLNGEAKYFTYNDDKTDKNVIVKGNGSSVVNVYYTRNSYTIKFTGYGKCSLDHTHTSNCNTNNSNNVIYTITAKYEATIGDIWPTYDLLKENEYVYKNSSGDVINKNGEKFRGWKIEGNNSELISKRITMTSDLCDTSDGVKTATAQYDAQYTVHLYYMFESFDQGSQENGNDRKYYNGKYYDKSELFYQTVNANSNTFNQKQITGMAHEGVVTETVSKNNEYNNFLYYSRNRSDLMFQNIDDTVKTVTDIMYEQPLKDYKDSDGNLLRSFKPEYPNLEPNAYEFKGWYTTPECFDGTEFDFNTATMPNGDLTLYAKWAPIKHRIDFYLTADKAAEGNEKLYDSALVEHGSKIDVVPKTPENNGYNFVGWFYLENGVEKAFDFANMPVNKDLVVYAKWNSDKLKQYFIYYKYKDGNGNIVDVAPFKTGSALAGSTKTFEAKGGDDLYAAYAEGYYPEVKSHSMTIDISDDAENSFTFWYVTSDPIPYTVRYVDKATNKDLVDPKTVNNNKKAVVTETFVFIEDMMPDAYQKRLVITPDGSNEIIFYYTKDTEHAYYKISHWIESVDGENWVEYGNGTQKPGKIGETIVATPENISGFTYDASKTEAVVNGNTELATEAVLTNQGLELKLYYTRNQYPYKVRYLEDKTGKSLSEEKTGVGKYGALVTEEAIDIKGYQVVNGSSQSTTIRVEEANNAKLNIITFYYQEKNIKINYKTVGKGTVDKEVENVKAISGPISGSTPTAGKGYYFVGWFTDKDCTNPVAESWVGADNKIIPQKTEGIYEAATYYAKFEPTSLTINKKVNGDITADQNQEFLFHIEGNGIDTIVKIRPVANENHTGATGSVTIKELPVGDYTVTEIEGWSWRYKADETVKRLNVSTANNITFTNTRKNNKWLDSNSSVDNVFTNLTTKSTDSN